MKNRPKDSDFAPPATTGLSLVDILAQAKTIYNDLLADGEKRLNELIDEAGNLDPAGKATAKTITARQALRNPTLRTTNVHAARKKADKALADSIGSTMPALRKILPELVSLLQASMIQNLLREADASIENKSRKRQAPPAGASREEMILLQKLRHAGVQPSAFDLLNAEEIQLVAGLLKIKIKTARHELPLPTTLALIAAGPDIIKVGTMPEDEADALRAWMQQITEAGFEARRALEDVVGRPLNISDSFAASLVQLPNNWMNAIYDAPVLSHNLETAVLVRREADIKMILKLLSIPENEENRKRADLILEPPGGLSDRKRPLFAPVVDTKNADDDGTHCPSNPSSPSRIKSAPDSSRKLKLDAEEACRVAEKIFDEGYFKDNFILTLMFAVEGKTPSEAAIFLESVEAPLGKNPTLKKIIDIIRVDGWEAANAYYSAETISNLEAGLRRGQTDLIAIAKYLGFIKW